MNNPEPIQVFISYTREDWDTVDELYKKLLSEGFKPWIDKVDLLGGQTWELEIKRAIKQSDFFLACFSNKASEKDSFFQKEIKYGLETQAEKREGRIFLVPLKLEECEIPDNIGMLQWIDYYEPDGFSRLLKTIRSQIKEKPFPPTSEFFAKAKRIDISGITLSNTIPKYTTIVVSRLTEEANVRFILAEASDEVLRQISSRSWRETPVEFYKMRIESSIMQIKVIGDRVKEKSPNSYGNLEIGSLPFVPSFGMTMADAHKQKGKVFIELYHHLKPQPPRNFLFQKDKARNDFEFYEGQFNAMWEASNRVKVL